MSDARPGSDRLSWWAVAALAGLGVSVACTGGAAGAVSGMAGAAGLLLWLVPARAGRLPSASAAALLAGLVALAGVTAAVSVEPERSLICLLGWLAALAALVLGQAVSGGAAGRAVLGGLLGGGVALALASHLGARTPLAMNRNAFAALLVMVAPAVWALWPATGRRARVALSVAALLLLTSVARSGSRSGCLGAGVVLLAVAWRAGWPPRRWRAVASCLAVLAVAAAGLRGGRDPSFEQRVFIWRTSVRMAVSRPWTGYGPGTFALAYTALRPPGERRPLAQLISREAHSLALHAAAELGLPATCLILALGSIALWSGWRAPRRTGHLLTPPGAAALGLAGLAVVGLVNAPLDDLRVLVAAAALCGLALGSRAGSRRASHAAMFVAVAVAVAGGWWSWRVDRAERCLTRAAAARSRGDSRAALEACQRAADADPWSPGPWLHMGEWWAEQAERNGDPTAGARAAAAWREAVRRSPWNAATHSQLGMLLVSLRREADGERELRQAFALDPYNGNFAAQLAACLALRRAYSAAEPWFDRADQLLQGQVYLTQVRYGRSGLPYANAVAARLRNLSAWALCCDRLGNPAQARVVRRWAELMARGERGKAPTP